MVCEAVTQWTMKDKMSFVRQLLEAMKFLHHNGIAHRDLKSQNIMLTLEEEEKHTSDDSKQQQQQEEEGTKPRSKQKSIGVEADRLWIGEVCASHKHQDKRAAHRC